MAEIHPTALVADGAQIAEGATIGPWCQIGPHVTIGPGTELRSHVVVEGRTTIGADCRILPFAVLGGPPQHNAYKGEPTRLEIGDRNRIGEHVTMHIGTTLDEGVTRVGDDCLLMVGAHVAHDCRVGNGVIFANNATLAGHCHIGEGVFLGGLCAMHQFSRVGDFAILGGGGILRGDIIPYGSAKGNSATLEGLNTVGLKRRGATRETLHVLRRAFRELFFGEGVLKDRTERVAGDYRDVPEVMRIVTFLRAPSKRPLCLPS